MKLGVGTEAGGGKEGEGELVAANQPLYPVRDRRNVRRTKGKPGWARARAWGSSGKQWVRFSSHVNTHVCLFFLFFLCSATVVYFLSHPSFHFFLQPSELVILNQRTGCGLMFPIDSKHAGCIPQFFLHAPTWWLLAGMAMPFTCQQKMWMNFTPSIWR